MSGILVVLLWFTSVYSSYSQIGYGYGYGSQQWLTNSGFGFNSPQQYPNSGFSQQGVGNIGNTAYQELFFDGKGVYGCRVQIINGVCPSDQYQEANKEYAKTLCTAPYHIISENMHCISLGNVEYYLDFQNKVKCRSTTNLPYLVVDNDKYEDLCVKKSFWSKLFGR